MLIGGLWHGAGWTFVVWGALHGLYLIVNHFWHLLRRAMNGGVLPEGSWMTRRLSLFVTFIAVVVGWVFFRAATFDGAINMLEGMAGLNGVTVPNVLATRLGSAADLLAAVGVEFTNESGSKFVLPWLWIIALSLIAFMAPNSLDLTRRYRPALGYRYEPPRKSRATARPALARDWGLAALRWRPDVAWSSYVAVLIVGGVLALPQVSEFLYFQF